MALLKHVEVDDTVEALDYILHNVPFLAWACVVDILAYDHSPCVLKVVHHTHSSQVRLDQEKRQEDDDHQSCWHTWLQNKQLDHYTA